ncbi:hypothetical protein MTBPR1_100104 [Candidatus Terasakiella magnetica]|uniref:Uncharacterized protein n=1 Tax=Candidatus Terasakiella magnetica TaxID=1867952 RepID=A0A1C3RDU3_9PROT|nr:hypothetical protein [Candidatus Terasakiella magnetica]SCA55463.1 hypothetical protein MTBPR1_100104 [Candidatus Terasakiella magnetica]
MPVEVRRIEFSEIELRKALMFYQARKEGEANVSGIKVMGGDEFNIVAKVSTAANDEVSRKVFDHATTIAVMVLYSKKAGIPLPRKARKMITPTEFGGVAMTVRYEHNVFDMDLSGIEPVSKAPTVASSGHA